MFSRAKVVACLLLLAGGCTGPSHNRGRAPDWSLDSAPSRAQPTKTPQPYRPAVPLSNRVEDVSNPVDAAQNWISVQAWSQQQGFEFKEAAQPGLAPAYSIRSDRGELRLRPNAQTAYWRGASVSLGFAPALLNNELFARELDVRKTFEPLLSSAHGTTGNSRVVVLDPGHGGHDSGTRSALNGDYEKDFTLDWAVRIRAILLRDGFQTVLTRAADVDVAIPDRVATAEQCNAAAFLSLHFNASGTGGEQSGIETYCLTPTGMPSSLTRGYGDDPAAVFPNNHFDTDNLRLACGVHQSLLRVNRTYDRGVRRARFLSVLRSQARPAVLVEGGYLSTTSEARLIGTAQYRQQLAQAVASALEQFLAGSSPLGR